MASFLRENQWVHFFFKGVLKKAHDFGKPICKLRTKAWSNTKVQFASN
jgi:hypothetical protein